MAALKIRQDDFSVQGMHKTDGHVFLRRLMPPEESVFTDALFGSLSHEDATNALSEFLEASGGLSGDHLEFADIGGALSERSKIVTRYDFLVSVTKAALANLNWRATNSFLEPDGDRFKAKIIISRLIQIH